MAKRIIGVDLGAENAKVVRLCASGKSYQLEAFGFLAYRGDMPQLKNFLLENSLTSGDTRINIEDASLKIRRLDLPILPEQELGEAVKWGMKNVLEGDVDEYDFRYSRIDKEDLKLTDKLPLLVFAVKREAVRRQIEISRHLNLGRPERIEPNASALASLFDAEVRQNPQAIIDLGSRGSLFLVIGRKGLLFSRPLSGCADSNLTEQIERDMGVNEAAAVELKNKYIKNAPTTPGEAEAGRLKNTWNHFYSKLALEIQRSLDGYFLMFEKQKILTLELCGGGAYYPGLLDYLQKTLGLEVRVADPFKNMDVAAFSQERLGSQKAMFAVACGLTLN